MEAAGEDAGMGVGGARAVAVQPEMVVAAQVAVAEAVVEVAEVMAEGQKVWGL